MQHLFVVSVIVAVCSIVTVILRLGADKATSISLHATKHKTAFLLVACGITLALALNVIYLFGWLIPSRSVGLVSTLLYLALTLLLFITAWVPDLPGRLRTVHRLAAYGAVFIMPVLLLALLLSLAMSWWSEIVLVMVIISHIVMIYLLFFVPSAYRHFLMYQGVYLVGFFLAMLSVTYA